MHDRLARNDTSKFSKDVVSSFHRAINQFAGGMAGKTVRHITVPTEQQTERKTHYGSHPQHQYGPTKVSYAATSTSRTTDTAVLPHSVYERRQSEAPSEKRIPTKFRISGPH